MSGQFARTCFLAGLLSTTVAAVSQTAVPSKAPESLKVVSSGTNHLQVQVGEPSTLAKVFKAICAEQKLDCTGAESLSSYPVPKMDADGTLREVVDNLLQGTGINYRYTRATSATKAKLVLLGHAPQGNNAALPARGNRENTPPPALHSMPYPGGVPAPGNTGATEPAQSNEQPQKPQN
jgi:hypothetical protein